MNRGGGARNYISHNLHVCYKNGVVLRLHMHGSYYNSYNRVQPALLIEVTSAARLAHEHFILNKLWQSRVEKSKTTRDCTIACCIHAVT